MRGLDEEKQFSFPADLSTLSKTPALWTESILPPAGSLAVVAFTISKYTKDENEDQSMINLNVMWTGVLGVEGEQAPVLRQKKKATPARKRK